MLNPHKLVNLKPNSPSCQEHCQPDTSARKKYYDKKKLKWSLKYILSLVGFPRLGLPNTSNMAIIDGFMFGFVFKTVPPKVPFVSTLTDCWHYINRVIWFGFIRHQMQWNVHRYDINPSLAAYLMLLLLIHLGKPS